MFGKHPDDLEPVADHLEKHWLVPERKPEGVEVDGFHIVLLHFDNVVEVGPMRVEGLLAGADIWQYAIPCSMRVVFK